MSQTTPFYARPMSDHDSRLWATVIHAAGALFTFLPGLVGYVVLGQQGAYIRQETRSALNFQLTVFIAYVVGLLTAFFIIGFVVLFAAFALNVVFSVLAAVASSRGEHWEYPVTIGFVPA